MGTYQFLCSITGWRIAIDLLLIAIFGDLYPVPLYAMMQNRSTPSHRARIIAVNTVINALFMVIAAVATAVMIKFGFSVIDIFMAIAICNGLVALYVCNIIYRPILLSIISNKQP